MSWGWGENYEESDATADHDSELPTTPSEFRLDPEQVSSDGPSYVSAPTCEVCHRQWCDDHTFFIVARARCFFNQLDVLTHNEKYVLHIGDQEDDFWTEYMDNDRYKHFQCPGCTYIVFEIRSPTVMTPETCKWCAWAAHTNECFSLRRLCTTGPQPGYRWPDKAFCDALRSLNALTSTCRDHHQTESAASSRIAGGSGRTGAAAQDLPTT